jgi:hypothetical protein
MNLMKRLVAIVIVLLTAGYAAAQDVSTLNPMARGYRVLGFSFDAPQGDGWREVGSGQDFLMLIYAEQVGADTINTRLAFEAHAFPIDDPSKAPEPVMLAQMSMSQRVKEFNDAAKEAAAAKAAATPSQDGSAKADDAPPSQDGDAKPNDASPGVVAMSNIQQLQSPVPVFEYTLVVKLGEEKERYITYFVALAPDKTQYFAAKLETQDSDYRDQSYFAPLHASMESLSFPPAEKPKTDAAAPSDKPAAAEKK